MKKALKIKFMAVFIMLLAAPFAHEPLWSAPTVELMSESPSQPSMCEGQQAVTEKELRISLSLMAELIALAPQLSPQEEEAIIRSRGFEARRLNCVLGKFMAANDIFGWGSAAAYGVTLCGAEKQAALKFASEAPRLKAYLSEELKIVQED